MSLELCLWGIHFSKITPQKVSIIYFWIVDTPKTNKDQVHPQKLQVFVGTKIPSRIVIKVSGPLRLGQTLEGEEVGEA